MTPEKRERLRELGRKRWAAMSPEAKLHRLPPWAKPGYWTPERRAEARERFQNLSPEERGQRRQEAQRRWRERFQNLSPEERERRRQALQEYWTPERRAEARERSKATRDKAWQTWRANHPERVPVVDELHAKLASGEILPGICDVCGKITAAPIYDWTPGQERHVGWRCYGECRRAKAIDAGEAGAQTSRP